MGLEQKTKALITQLDIKDYIEIFILFGSRARGDYNKNSDIDIAVLLDEQFLMNTNSLELRSEMISLFSSGLGKDCDLVFINQAGPLLKYQIIKYGKILYIKDKVKYGNFFSRVLKEYFDFKYYQELHYNSMLDKIKKGGAI